MIPQPIINNLLIIMINDNDDDNNNNNKHIDADAGKKVLRTLII
jgi:hypothetical protein